MRGTALMSRPWEEWNSVATTPGQTTPTVTPESSTSAARVWVIVTR